MKRLAFLCLTLAAASAFLLTGCQNSQSTDSSSASQTVAEDETTGKNAFTRFTAQTLDGQEADQTLFQGHKLTMINIWGTFCPPCLKEMPDLGALNKEYADKGFQVIGIVSDAGDLNGNIDDAQVEKAKQIAAETGADYVHLLPSPDLIANKLYEVSSIPETLFVNEQGQQVGRSYVGMMTKAEWEKIINDLLEAVE